MDLSLKLLGRTENLFKRDILANKAVLSERISQSRFLVIGAAGSIGQAVTKEIFQRNPKVLHAVDINENELVELTRSIRSSMGYIDGDYATFVLDIDSEEFDAFIKNGSGYDYVLNLSALKHVRSEKDPYTLMRMIRVNIFNTKKTILQAIEKGAKKYFCVSTDKAANPANLMGATKRIMEMYLKSLEDSIDISSARFANVAFSQGSLLAGFRRRLESHQPIAAPTDVRRYFLTLEESGQLCLLSCMLGGGQEVFFPKLRADMHLSTFSDIAKEFLKQQGYEALECGSEEEARQRMNEVEKGKWPCFFFSSDTTGEKDVEEFYTDTESPIMDRYEGVGIIANSCPADEASLVAFEKNIRKLLQSGSWSKEQLKAEITKLLPFLSHKETGKYLDSKM